MLWWDVRWIFGRRLLHGDERERGCDDTLVFGCLWNCDFRKSDGFIKIRVRVARSNLSFEALISWTILRRTVFLYHVT